MSQPENPGGPNPPGFKWDAAEGGWISEAQWNAKQAYYKNEVEKILARRKRNGIIACIAGILFMLWGIPLGLGDFGWFVIVLLIAALVFIIRKKSDMPNW